MTDIYLTLHKLEFSFPRYSYPTMILFANFSSCWDCHLHFHPFASRINGFLQLVKNIFRCSFGCESDSIHDSTIQSYPRVF